ncbi:hypothetical protein HMPREF9720_2684 [Alistipes sp. HGB5]|jgi:hypothetical protein|nr:hypothetical protein HMPREF9720_2684 [Alistipes sp. HGB5]
MQVEKRFGNSEYTSYLCCIMKIRVLAFTGQDSYFFTMFNSKLLLCGGGFRKVLDAGRAFSDA